MEMITGNKPFSGLDAYVKNIGKGKARINGSPEEAPKGGGLTEDKVALSPEAKQIQDVKKRLDSLPDVREDKVAEIKEQIEAGTYTIDGEKIAFKMIRESILDAMS
jgi:negative regulator of flagellin synthesis FlgM